MVQLPTLLDHPLVQRLCPPTVAPRLLRLWDNRDLLLDVLDRLPQTLGHHDVWRPNAVLRAQADGGEQLVLLDWGFTGTGALGHDPGHLAGSLIDAPDITLRHAQDLDHQVFDGYTAGLREAGWQGNTATVRLGYTAALAVRSLFSNLPLFLGAALREDHHAFWEQTFGAPMGDIFDMTSRPFAFFLERGDEAQTLAARF